MKRLITISYTSLDAGGGVPAFNRALHAAFPDRECIHYCWTDFPWYIEVDARGETEWGRARLLNEYLVRTRKVTTDDVVVADGFWAWGLEHIPFAVSHSHGIWSHLTHEDVLAGKQPDMPQHHAAQVAFRQQWTGLEKHITAVSDFIANQMKLQWGFEVDRVINNGVDTDLWKPDEKVIDCPRPFIIHGVNDRGNINKGWDHIEAVKQALQDVLVLSLDEAVIIFSVRGDKPWTKEQVLAQADLVVHPSGYEGNSMFVAEALACGVPIVGYNVGALANQDALVCGIVFPLHDRSPEKTLDNVMTFFKLSESYRGINSHNARQFALNNLSLTRFNDEWQSYVKEIENA